MNKLNTFKIHLLLFTIATLTFQSCDIFDLDHTPISCIPKYINFIKKYGGHCKANIIEFKFQNRLVYYIKPGDCSEHEQVLIINSNCDTLGFLKGANSNSIVNGEDFYDNARKLRTIWKN